MSSRASFSRELEGRGGNSPSDPVSIWGVLYIVYCGQSCVRAFPASGGVVWELPLGPHVVFARDKERNAVGAKERGVLLRYQIGLRLFSCFRASTA